MENSALSALSLEKLCFDHISYSRKDEHFYPQNNYEMNFQREISECEGKNHYKIKLSANIWSEGKLIELSISLTGYFTCECDDESMRETLIKDNTVAIMLPYLRSQISLVSTQPDVPPIVLPTINVVELFKDSESKK